MKKIKIFIVLILILLVLFAFYKRNSKEINVFVEAKDDVAPTIILDKESIVIAKGNEYSANIKATDNVDGDITNKIISSGEVDTNIPGDYEVKYTVSDSCGNKAEITQKVEVRNELKIGLPVLMYHFFYMKDDPNYAGKTPDNNLIMVEKFAEQMDYLVQENYYFPTWQEVEDYIDGKINLPEKSVVITDDDGNFTFFVLAVPVVEDRKIPTTSFIITSWYEERLDEKYEYINYQSHSDNMHKSGANGKGAIVNWTYDEIIKDLNNSKNKIKNHTGNSCTVFCYPFGHYNDTAKKALKDAGYNLAFTVEGGRVKPGADKFALPRVRINGNTTMNEFKEAVK